MCVPVLALVHLTIKGIEQFVVMLDFVSCVICKAMPPYGGYSGK